MKKALLLIVVLLTVVSCQESTTYTLNHSLPIFKEGMGFRFTFYEYDNVDKCVNTHSFDVVDAKTKKYTAKEGVVKVMLTIKLIDTWSDESIKSKYWVPDIFYLTKGKNTNIHIDKEAELLQLN